MVNVYFKSSFPVKIIMSDDLYFRKSSFDGEIWCVLGDFNFVSSLSKRIGINGYFNLSSNAECVDFFSFIYQMDLFDLPLLDRKFTWFQPNGRAVNMLDQILVSDG